MLIHGHPQDKPREGEYSLPEGFVEAYLERRKRWHVESWPYVCRCGCREHTTYHVASEREGKQIAMWQCVRCSAKLGPAIAHPAWVESWYSRRASTPAKERPPEALTEDEQRARKGELRDQLLLVMAKGLCLLIALVSLSCHDGLEQHPSRDSFMDACLTYQYFMRDCECPPDRCEYHSEPNWVGVCIQDEAEDDPCRSAWWAVYECAITGPTCTELLEDGACEDAFDVQVAECS